MQIYFCMNAHVLFHWLTFELVGNINCAFPNPFRTQNLTSKCWKVLLPPKYVVMFFSATPCHWIVIYSDYHPHHVIMKIKVSCYPVFPSCSTQPFVCWTIPSLWSISKDLPFRNPIAANSFCQQIISVIIICSQKYQSLAALSNCYNLVQLFKNTKSGSMYMGGMPDSIFLVLLCCWAAYLKCKSS